MNFLFSPGRPAGSSRLHSSWLRPALLGCLLALPFHLAPQSAQAQSFTSKIVDSGGNVGAYSSQAVVDGRPAISYVDDTNSDLKFAINSAADGSGTWTIRTVGNLGAAAYTSLAVLNGKPAIAYCDVENGALKFAINSVADGSGTWTIQTIDSEGYTGLTISLAVVDGKPAISYTTFAATGVRYAINSATDGSGTWTIQTVGGEDDSGSYTSLAVIDGKPAIAYGNANIGASDLRFAINSAADGSGTWTIQIVDTEGSIGFFTTLAEVDGKPAIAYLDNTNKDLKYAINSAANGSGTWTKVIVDSAGDVGEYASLSLVGGKPAVSYLDRTNGDLKYASNAASDGLGAWAPVTVDSAGDVGAYSSLKVVNGRPAITYYDNTNADLKWATLSDTVKPTVTVTNPSGGQVISAPTWSSISGGAKDNVGVTGVQFKLFRTRNGVTTYWNGESFVNTSFTLTATVASPGSTSTTWSYAVSSQLKATVDAGTYTIYAYASDAAGNKTSAYGRNFTITLPETVKPTVTVTNPAGGQVIPANSWSSISGGAKDNVGVTGVQFKLFRTRNGVKTYWNGADFGSVPEMIPATIANPGSTDTTWSYSIPSSLKAAVDAGAYTIYAYASDAAGNTTSAFGRNFTISVGDDVKPTVTVTNPTGGQVIPAASWSNIGGGAKDNLGVAGVKFKLFRNRNGVTSYWNGSSFGRTSVLLSATVVSPGATSTTWSFNISSSLKAAVDSGAYTIYAYSTDVSGNTTPAYGRNFTITTSNGIAAVEASEEPAVDAVPTGSGGSS